MRDSASDKRLETFVGIDLGGSRGKTTAVSLLRRTHGTKSGVSVQMVSTRSPAREAWTDEVLLRYVADMGPGVCVAVNGPLTVPACQRCTETTCPGITGCLDPSVVWLRTEGSALASALRAGELVATSASAYVSRAPASRATSPTPLVPYIHRVADVDLHHRRRLSPRATFGQNLGPIAARGDHLRRRFATMGIHLNRRLLEVSSAATVAALFDARTARGYKRDADPWETRATIVEELPHLRFAPTSRMSREEVLGNDHCFEALLAAFTAHLFAVEDWKLPYDAELADLDGYIWAPDPR